MRQTSLFPKSGLPSRLRADFEAFWKAYPARRPNPRALAEAAFARAVADGAEPVDLVRAAAGYAAECKRLGTEPAFIVHAATFLRQQRFLDYLTAPEAAKPAAPAETAFDHPLWPALRGVLVPREFERWILPLVVASITEGESALLVAPTRFHRDWVRQNHHIALRQALRVRVLNIEIPEAVTP